MSVDRCPCGCTDRNGYVERPDRHPGYVECCCWSTCDWPEKHTHRMGYPILKVGRRAAPPVRMTLPVMAVEGATVTISTERCPCVVVEWIDGGARVFTGQRASFTGKKVKPEIVHGDGEVLDNGVRWIRTKPEEEAKR